MIMERKESKPAVKLGNPIWIRFFDRGKKVLERKLNPFTDSACARDIVRKHWHLAPKKRKWTAASIAYDNNVVQMTSLIKTKIGEVEYLSLTNSNSYSAPSMNIDTGGNLTDIETALSHTITTADKIYIYNGATLTFNASRSLLQIILGQMSSGAAGAGNRYGLVNFGAYTITWDGSATNTNSGVSSNPTSADTSSKGCSVTANGTTFTNSVGANNTSNKWTFNLYYCNTNIVNCALNYYWLFLFNYLPCDSARCNSFPVVRSNTFGAPGASGYQAIGIGSTNIINGYCDFRFNTFNGASNFGGYLIGFSSAGSINSGGVIDYAGINYNNNGGTGIWNMFFGCNSSFYLGQNRISYADVRPTQIVPTGLALTNPGTGSELHFTITNDASYATTDMICIYNNTTMICRIGIARYRALGYGVIYGLTDGTAYTQINAAATSDGINFSAASANAAAVIPTHAAQTLGGHLSRRQ